MKPNRLRAMFELIRRFERMADRMGFRNMRAKVIGYYEGNVATEEGKRYTYPETFEVKVENWNNHFYSYRVDDGAWIREGTDLTGNGLSTAQVYRRQLRELRKFKQYIEQYDRKKKGDAS
jgi:hypothetical protein